MTHHNEEGFFMEEAAGGGLYTAKRIIVDVADSYGFDTYMGLRQLDLMFEASKIPLLGLTDVVGTATTVFGPLYLTYFAMDTSTSKTGSQNNTTWLSANGGHVNQRLNFLLTDIQTFDGMVMNNYHHNGTVTGRGCKNVKIYITEDAGYGSTTYGEAVTGGTPIFDGVFPEHAPTDTVQDFPLTLI